MNPFYMLFVGVVIGVFFTCFLVSRLVIGTLKTRRDEYDGEVYLYVELDRPYYPKHKYVVMRVDNSRR